MKGKAHVVKDSCNRVVNVAFKSRDGGSLPGGAARINQATDWNLEFPYDELAKHLDL